MGSRLYLLRTASPKREGKEMSGGLGGGHYGAGRCGRGCGRNKGGLMDVLSVWRRGRRR